MTFFNKNKKYKNSGFTIIEMMVAIALFLVIIIFGMQALLNANFVHRKSQDMRSVLDSLSFALDDMSKNIRVGNNYFCIDSDADFYNITDQKPKSCKDGFGIAFESSKERADDGTDQWAYFIGNKKLFRSTGPTYNQGINDVQMTPDNVEIDEFSSGFSVLGAESEMLNGDRQQPFVVIRLSGKIRGNNNSVTEFSVETAVSQRLIDVDSLSGSNDILVPEAPTGSEVVGAQTAQEISREVPESVESSRLINRQ
jgi:prepilin-type N-terminal cleavage/methylation domain-containing protein